MSTLQLTQRLGVRELAAMIKRLSRKQRDKLRDLVWDDLYDIPPEHIIPDDELKKIMDPRISVDEYKKMLELRK
jgi:hypothetical protein